MNMHIRWMIRRDMPGVLQIEKACFDCPWDMEAFTSCLRTRNCIGRVAVDCETDRVVAYMVYELHKHRLNVLNIGVDPDYRRSGVGKTLIQDLINKLSHGRRDRIMLTIRESNLAGLLFFKRIGFKAISILKDYWLDSDEDAYVMQYRYIATEEDLIKAGKFNAMEMQG